MYARNVTLCRLDYTRLVLYFDPRGKYTLNATELARNKFNALFADYDAKNIRATAEGQKSALKTAKKSARKHVKPQ